MRYSEDDILRMLRDGEERGMSALFKRYYRPLVVFADTFLHDWEEAAWLVLWRWLVCRAGAEDGIMVGYKCMEQ